MLSFLHDTSYYGNRFLDIMAIKIRLSTSRWGEKLKMVKMLYIGIYESIVEIFLLKRYLKLQISQINEALIFFSFF